MVPFFALSRPQQARRAIGLLSLVLLLLQCALYMRRAAYVRSVAVHEAASTWERPLAAVSPVAAGLGPGLAPPAAAANGGAGGAGGASATSAAEVVNVRPEGDEPPVSCPGIRHTSGSAPAAAPGLVSEA